MNSDNLFEYVEMMAEKANDGIRAMRTSKGVGFAIPLPEESITEEVKNEVDIKLSKLMWSFQRCMIGHKEYYVLFPMGQ